ncbi:hypothetical protein HDZ31DRAFT_43775 [Schizophyllum fasciatum]
MALHARPPPPATCRGVFLRRAVRAGDVYVFEPKSAVAEPNGIERWTDGVSWNPSKNKDYFLYYDEKPRQLPAVESGERHYYLLKRTYAATVTPQPGAVPRELHLVWYAARDDAHNKRLVHILQADALQPVLAHLPSDIDAICVPKRNVRRANDRQRRERRRTIAGPEALAVNREQAFAGPVLLSHAKPSIDAIAADPLARSPPGLFANAQITPRWPPRLPPLAPVIPDWKAEGPSYTQKKAQDPPAVASQGHAPTLSMGLSIEQAAHSHVPAHPQPPGLRPPSPSWSSSSSSPASDSEDTLPERMRGDVPPFQRRGLFGSERAGIGSQPAAQATFYIPLPALRTPSHFGESGAVLPDVQDMPVIEHYQKRDESDDRMLQQLEKYFHI